MLLSITETFIGLILLNIGLNSLKKSVIRSWRQGFTVTLVTGVIIMIYGLISLVIEMPVLINNILFFLAISSMTFSVFLISRMQGLNA
ncbi:MAG: hypothetical protein PHN56_01110 [Candidatus Nanoarchaeia archaeon]|nr:hypothetical protein [Candidatus Nanoarchaeia archaeon]